MLFSRKVSLRDITTNVTMQQNLETNRDQLLNNHNEFVLPDPEEVANEWGNLEDDISEEPIDDDNPFATMPIDVHQNEDLFTLEDIITQILDCNDPYPLITTPMDIEEN